MRILILCTGNSCRSQMAAGFLRHQRPRWEVASAGTYPAVEVHPLAIKVMAEAEIDLGAAWPQSVDGLVHQPFDYVITVCDNAKESCPAFTGKVEHQLHVGFPDPAKATGSDDEILAIFREVRDAIRQWFEEFVKEIETDSGEG